VRGILSVLPEASGRPIGHECRVDPTMGGRADTLWDVEAGCQPEHHYPARLGTTTVVADAYRGS
jgi:hypothetical protein